MHFYMLRWQNVKKQNKQKQNKNKFKEIIFYILRCWNGRNVKLLTFYIPRCNKCMTLIEM